MKKKNKKKTRTTIYNRPRIEEIERALYIFLYDRTMVMTKAPQPTLGNDTWRFIIGFKLCVCVFFILFFLLLLPDLSWFISRWKFMNRCFCAAFFVCSRPVVKGNKRGGLYYFLLCSAAAACSTTS